MASPHKRFPFHTDLPDDNAYLVPLTVGCQSQCCHDQVNYSLADSTRCELDQHLILYHEQSGGLYSSKLPEKHPPAGGLNSCGIELQLPKPVRPDMAHSCFLRWLVTFLHSAIAVVAGFCFVFSLFGTMFSDQCLPSLRDRKGAPTKFEHGFPTLCETIVVGLGVVSGINALLGLTARCFINKPGVVLFSLMLTAWMGAFAIFGGSTFTVHYLLWCDSISQNLPYYNDAEKCSEVAKIFDRNHKITNMTAFQTQMQVQQTVMWTLFPLTSITVLAYAAVLRMRAAAQNYLDDSEEEPAPSGFYRYLVAAHNYLSAPITSHERYASAPPSEQSIRYSTCNERTPFIAPHVN